MQHNYSHLFNQTHPTTIRLYLSYFTNITFHLRNSKSSVPILILGNSNRFIHILHRIKEANTLGYGLIVAFYRLLNQPA